MVLLLVLLIIEGQSLYGHWILNRSFIAYTSVLLEKPHLKKEQAAHASLAEAFRRTVHYRPALLQRPELHLLSALSGGDFDKNSVGEVCPVNARDYLFIRMLNRTGSFVKAEQHEVAEQWLLQLGKLCPESFEVFKGLARLKEMSGEYEAAIEFMEKAARLEPHIPDEDWRQSDTSPLLWKRVVVARAKSDVGNLHFKKGDYTKAVEVLEASVDAYPPGTISPWLYNMIGALAFEVGAYEKAKWAFEEGLKIDSTLPEAPMYLRKIQAKIQEGSR